MNKNLQEIGTNIRPATDNLDAYIKEETEMTRTIKTASQGYLSESLDFVEKVFTDSEGTESGKK